MNNTASIQEEQSMSPTMEVSCRVDYREINGGSTGEHTSRVDTLSATGCAIRTGEVPDGKTLELRIYLPDGEWPIRIDHATVTWERWDAFAVEFVDMPAADQHRLRKYLSTESMPTKA